MSCQQNAGQAAKASARNGVSKTANKVAYAVGAALTTAAGAGVGGMIGAGIGSILGPPGTVAGAGVGAVAGGRMGYRVARDTRDKIREVSRRAAAEKAWKDSRAGQRAVKSRTTQLQRAGEAYKARTAKLEARQETSVKQYQVAKKEWLAQNTGLNAALKSPKEAVISPEGKAAAAGVLQGALNVAGQVLSEAGQTSRPGGQASGPAGRDLGRRVGQETVRQARQYRSRVEEARQKAWLGSPEGQVTEAKYKKTMKKLKTQQEAAAGAYNRRRTTINRSYNTSRSNFLSQHSQSAASQTA